MYFGGCFCIFWVFFKCFWGWAIWVLFSKFRVISGPGDLDLSHWCPELQSQTLLLPAPKSLPGQLVPTSPHDPLLLTGMLSSSFKTASFVWLQKRKFLRGRFSCNFEIAAEQRLRVHTGNKQKQLRYGNWVLFSREHGFSYLPARAPRRTLTMGCVSMVSIWTTRVEAGAFREKLQGSLLEEG